MSAATFTGKTLKSIIGITSLLIFTIFYSMPVLGLRELDEISPDLPGIPVPEPTTLVLFITSAGIFGGYDWWRRRKSNLAQSSIALLNIPESEQCAQEERIAAVGQMTGEIMHDVKNALTGIRTCAEVLGYDDSTPEERIEFAKIIVMEVDRVFGMTQELLEFSYGGQKSLNLEMCSVRELIQDILLAIKCDFTNRNITIHTNLHYTGQFQSDVAKMKRVIMNVIDNARDAMPEGGTLTISSRLIHDMVEIEFTDTGCGMPSELQARMFEPLFTEGKPNGTGLGMAIVKEIVDAHHGHIEVESVAGEGTTIRILLPCTTVLFYYRCSDN